MEESYEHILMQEAYEALHKGEYARARHVFDDVLKRLDAVLPDTQKSLIHGELATVLFYSGEYDDALRHCHKAAALSPQNFYIYVLLGKIAIARFDFAAARSNFLKVPEADAGRGAGLTLLAIKLRDTHAARVELTALTQKIDRTDQEYLVYQAYVLLLEGDLVNALGSARRCAVDASSYDPFLRATLAEIFMTAGSYAQASVLADSIIKQCPSNDAAYAINAHSAYAQENFSQAETMAQEAVRLNPRNAYAQTILMKSAVRSGLYDRAERYGLEILDHSPQYSLGHANLGDVYFIQGRYELARLEYEQTLELMNSQTKGASLRQARMAFIRQEYREAAAILERLITSHHTYYDDAVCDLALCYEKLGDEEKKLDLKDAMVMRRSFYHRTEALLKQLHFSA